MLTHKNMYWTSAASADLCQLDSSDKNLSFLPLSHIAEQMVLTIPYSLLTICSSPSTFLLFALLKCIIARVSQRFPPRRLYSLSAS